MFGDHNVSAMSKRVGVWLDRANAEQISYGTSWYQDARVFAADLAEHSPHSLTTVAGVVAVLSPQTTWDQNQQAAANVVEAHARGERTAQYSGYKTNLAKAFAILDGDLSCLRGPKVTAFHRAILGDMSLATIDVWATRTARDRVTNLAYAFRDDETPGVVEMRAMQEGYRRAAARRGYAPGEAQAIAWLTIKQSGQWVRPQHMPGRGAQRFYARHIAARRRLGLTIHTRPGYWGLATNGLAAALSA